ncbi:MAG: hypothetical protein C4291_03085 [Candidatus Dadabacteria bacterium]
MGTLFRRSIKRILVLTLILSLFGCAGTPKSPVQRNERGINEAYLGCLMFNNDNNSVQECSDLRWGAEQALYNNMKTPSTVTIKDLRKATPPEASQK